MNCDFIRKSLKLVGILCVMFAWASLVIADEQQPEELDVPFEPTHPAVAEAMLKQLAVTPNDIHFDLGCGDGRFLIMAVKKFNVEKAVGIDIDPQRVKEATENAAFEGVSDRVEVRKGDIMDADIGEATTVSIYLLNTVNLMIRPKLFRDLTQAPESLLTHSIWPIGKQTRLFAIPELVARSSITG